MGRFSTVCFVLLAACGDISEPGDLELAPVDGVDATTINTQKPRYVPMVCGSQSWTADVTESVHLSVTTRPGGVIALATPRAGGTIDGFVLDTRMQMTSMKKVDIDGAFESVTASYLADRIVSTAVADNTIVLHLLDDELADPQYMTKMQGRFVAEPAFFRTQADLVVPTAGDDGLWLHRFGDGFELTDSKLLIATDKPATSVAAAQMGVATMLAVSTPTDCHMMLTSTFSAGISGHAPRSCDSPRIAAGKSLEAVMVFDSPEGVRLMNIVGGQFGGDGRVLRAGTSAPRALFDGTNYWVSYLDDRGDVIVGFLDQHYQPVTMSLGGPRPESQAYEMVLVNGSPWVVTLDSDGYTATRMCLDTL